MKVHGRTTTLRDPDEDYVLIQCVRQAAGGGSSLVADGYRVVDHHTRTSDDVFIFSCLQSGRVGHGVGGSDTPAALLDAEGAATVAATLQALATPSRLLMLTRLRQSPCSVGELADAVGMEQSAVSHQIVTCHCGVQAHWRGRSARSSNSRDGTCAGASCCWAPRSARRLSPSLPCSR